MQVVELALQLDDVLAVHKAFDQILVRTFLAVRQVFDHTLAMQQLGHLSQTILQAFL